jgi:hypothetical protein
MSVELIQAVDRLQRAMPRNPLVIAVVDAMASLPHNITRNIMQPSQMPPELERNVTPSAPTLCPECATRRAANAKAQARFRAKMKSLEGTAA